MRTPAFDRYFAPFARHGAAMTVLGAMMGLLLIATIAPPLSSSGEPPAMSRLVSVL